MKRKIIPLIVLVALIGVTGCENPLDDDNGDSTPRDVINNAGAEDRSMSTGLAFDNVPEENHMTKSVNVEAPAWLEERVMAFSGTIWKTTQYAAVQFAIMADVRQLTRVPHTTVEITTVDGDVVASSTGNFFGSAVTANGVHTRSTVLPRDKAVWFGSVYLDGVAPEEIDTIRMNVSETRVDHDPGTVIDYGALGMWPITMRIGVDVEENVTNRREIHIGKAENNASLEILLVVAESHEGVVGTDLITRSTGRISEEERMYIADIAAPFPRNTTRVRIFPVVFGGF